MKQLQSTASTIPNIFTPSTHIDNDRVVTATQHNPFTQDKHNASLCVDISLVQDATQMIHSLSEHNSIYNVKQDDNNSGMLEVCYDSLHIKGKHIVDSLFAQNVRTRIAIIYCKPIDRGNSAAHTLKAVTANDGVVAAEHPGYKAYLLIVHFDPRQTTSSIIARNLQKQGFTALLVGC